MVQSLLAVCKLPEGLTVMRKVDVMTSNLLRDSQISDKQQMCSAHESRSSTTGAGCNAVTGQINDITLHMCSIKKNPRMKVKYVE